ncbi:hypothetical protein GA830_12230 [Mesorhizobium sp. NBSH29]|uniref:hypothetical protein n=1 Tax=Mesorhizobium sp. NBSH29 TaxID=2654249 RepID=UPI0018964E97|nr:hypothetical protein [Mesorhizobium sp. NBSH29]QPC87425.1 hypothetical protein GA830_12230 [Mesorhizobium sp. NBSH29]
MTNRIIMNSSGVKLSRPGIDVLSASDINLLFNSNYMSIGLFQAGTLSTTTGFTSYWFGLTLPILPLVSMLVEVAAGVWQHSSRAVGSSDKQGLVQYRVYNDRMEVKALSAGYACRYSVWVL